MNTNEFISHLESRTQQTAKRNSKGWLVRCPAHEDKSPSLNIADDGVKILIHCHAGCPPEAVCAAVGVRMADLFADGGRGHRTRSTLPPVKVAKPCAAAPKPAPSNLVEVSPGTPQDWNTLAELRNVSPEAVELAVKRGLIAFDVHHGRPSWLVGDCTSRNVQARRMDGLPWAEINAKAWTFKGSRAAWPVGIHEAQPFASIALVEGGPDLLAAFHFIYCEGRQQDATAVAMLGAGHNIPAEALTLFMGKRVRIFGHCDGAGCKSVVRWWKQLRNAGANVDAFRFDELRKTDGSPIKDLNDCTSIDADDFEANRELWGMIP